MAAIIAVKRSLLLLAEERISARQKERLRVEPRLLSLYGLMIALFFPSFLSLFLSLFRFFLLSFLALSFLPSLLFVPSSFHFFLSNEEEFRFSDTFNYFLHLESSYLSTATVESIFPVIIIHCSASVKLSGKVFPRRRGVKNTIREKSILIT